MHSGHYGSFSGFRSRRQTKRMRRSGKVGKIGKIFAFSAAKAAASRLNALGAYDKITRSNPVAQKRQDFVISFKNRALWGFRRAFSFVACRICSLEGKKPIHVGCIAQNHQLDSVAALAPHQCAFGVHRLCLRVALPYLHAGKPEKCGV